MVRRRIQELHAHISEISHISRHPSPSAWRWEVGGGGKLAVGGGESDGASVAARDKVAPDVSDAGVEAEDAAFHPGPEAGEPHLKTRVLFTLLATFGSTAYFTYSEGADVELGFGIAQPFYHRNIRLEHDQFAEEMSIHEVI